MPILVSLKNDLFMAIIICIEQSIQKHVFLALCQAKQWRKRRSTRKRQIPWLSVSYLAGMRKQPKYGLKSLKNGLFMAIITCG